MASGDTIVYRDSQPFGIAKSEKNITQNIMK
jgi:hypothetical protein